MIDHAMKILIQSNINIFDHIGYLPRDLKVFFQYLNRNLVVTFDNRFIEPYLNCCIDYGFCSNNRCLLLIYCSYLDKIGHPITYNESYDVEVLWMIHQSWFNGFWRGVCHLTKCLKVQGGEEDPLNKSPTIMSSESPSGICLACLN